MCCEIGCWDASNFLSQTSTFLVLLGHSKQCYLIMVVEDWWDSNFTNQIVFLSKYLFNVADYCVNPFGNVKNKAVHPTGTPSNKALPDLKHAPKLLKDAFPPLTPKLIPQDKGLAARIQVRSCLSAHLSKLSCTTFFWSDSKAIYRAQTSTWTSHFEAQSIILGLHVCRSYSQSWGDLVWLSMQARVRNDPISMDSMSERDDLSFCSNCV